MRSQMVKGRPKPQNLPKLGLDKGSCQDTDSTYEHMMHEISSDHNAKTSLVSHHARQSTRMMQQQKVSDFFQVFYKMN